MSTHRYLIALGSNQRHPMFGRPRDVLQVAIDRMSSAVGAVLAQSPIITSAPIGPSQRRYANGAVVISTNREPEDLLESLQELEQVLGRERRGQRWRARTLDLDIVLWCGGILSQEHLQIPHPAFREREFVLGPAMAVAAGWRDPVTGLTIKQLHSRLTKPKPTPR
ncbi:MAG: 2-amino-4-hydroxy-6-hydroxymethyldihydropteridine diphosphokinase [Sphingomonadaceae bacterium]|nr:2-amino-4-hydroxy-6-hydroxymethyldihydropteridine diphosphokinase [Sphingomonadaceae bacterium]